ncbi:MAG: precorrin-6Y C5,15-methyltransferase (decarboxylating) subunit CbiT [Fervidobacterium sp.]
MKKVFGIKDYEFELSDKIPYTKEEVRAIIFHKLNLKESSVLWDIGSGTGTISIEFANLLPKGRVYSIDKDPHAFDVMKKNIQKFNLKNIVPIFGEAPEVLKNLEVPTHIFIGGTDQRLKEILAYILEIGKKSKIIEKIIMTVVSIETFIQSVELINSEEFRDFSNHEIIQIHISKASKISKYTILKPANPIFLFDISPCWE